MIRTPTRLALALAEIEGTYNFRDDYTTMRQFAHGAPDGDHWCLGFNISRKFF